MAVIARERRLINPTRKRRKNPKRKMSPKQIAIFGTARQKAALRASRSRKRNAGFFSKRRTKKRFIKAGYGSGEAKKYIAHQIKQKRRAKRKTNVGEIVSISLAGLNPGKKRRSGMARRRRRAKVNAGHKTRRRVYRRRRVSNPSVRRHRRSYRHRAVARVHRRRRGNPTYRVRRIHRRRHNPVVGSGIIIKILEGIGGFIATRYVTQFALGSKNTGVMGYAGNAVVAVALGWGAGKLTKSKEVATNVMVGGLVSVVARILMDYTPVGQYLNLSLQGAGKSGDIGIGIIQDSSFFTPQVTTPGSMTSFVTPRSTRDYVSTQLAQRAQMAAAGTRGGVGTVFGRRKTAVM